MKKTICIVRSNPVDPDTRVEKEAASLKKVGYHVVILAWDRTSNHKCRHEYIDAYDEKIDIYRIGCKADFGAGMKSIVPYLRFQFYQLYWLVKNRKTIDVIHSCDFDTALFSSLANRLIKKKYVFDIFDFICGKPKNVLEKIVKQKQIEIINRADITIICTEKRKEQIKPAHPHKLIVIHNTPIQKKVAIRKVPSLINESVKIVYVGILQDFRLLLEISDALKNNPHFELHIGGFGKYEEYFQKLSEEYKNIFFYGKMAYDKTIELENSCDVMLAIYDPKVENHIFAAPNKFYESLMLGKPVIMVKGTGMSEYIERYRLGVTIEYSSSGFKKGLEQLLEMKNEWNEMSERMINLYHSEFEWDVMAKRLVEAYSNLFNEHA